MKNVIFISPNFPENYWHFCHELKENGMNVLGIGDQPFELFYLLRLRAARGHHRYRGFERHPRLQRLKGAVDILGIFKKFFQDTARR